jgi:hypothetical protein
VALKRRVAPSSCRQQENLVQPSRTARSTKGRSNAREASYAKAFAADACTRLIIARELLRGGEGTLRE